MDSYDKHCKKTGVKIARGSILMQGEYQLAACTVVITNQKKLLVTQRHPSKPLSRLWEFSGGAVEEHEISIEAARRELYEEVGLECDKKEMKFIQTCHDEPFHLLVDVFLFLEQPLTANS